MAIYLRGDVWWFEVRTPTRRVRRSTGFHKDQRAQAQAVFEAARLTMRTKPPRDAAKVILDAIYSRMDERRDSLPISSVWSVYEEWARGKGKVLSAKETRDRRSVMRAFEAFAVEHRAVTAERVDVALARAFIQSLGGANKTLRNKSAALSAIWEAVGQMRPGIHNPWRAACPEDDGSGERRDPFTADECARIMSAAGEIGHRWRELCMVGLFTGQRYADCATLVWGDSREAASSRHQIEHGVVDLDRREIVLDPSKTRRHGTRLVIPVSDDLLACLSALPNMAEGVPVFPEQSVKVSQRSEMDPPFRDVLARAGVTEGYHDFHSFRHTLRTMLSDAGVSRETASRFGGWTTARMGDHYDHSRHLDEMREALLKLKK